MHHFKFKTNINCGSCIAAVSPVLNQIDEIENWQVDTTNPDKILSISGEDELTPKDIIMALEKLGYSATPLN